MRVPTIDLRDPDQEQLQSLDAACRDHGFFLLRNHGIDNEVEKMWKASTWFFNLAREFGTTFEFSLPIFKKYEVGCYN